VTFSFFLSLRVEFLLTTDRRYPRGASVISSSFFISWRKGHKQLSIKLLQGLFALADLQGPSCWSLALHADRTINVYASRCCSWEGVRVLIGPHYTAPRVLGVFSSSAKRTNNANNATHHVRLGKKRRESSKCMNYIISPRVISEIPYLRP